MSLRSTLDTGITKPGTQAGTGTSTDPCKINVAAGTALTLANLVPLVGTGEAANRLSFGVESEGAGLATGALSDTTLKVGTAGVTTGTVGIRVRDSGGTDALGSDLYFSITLG